MKYLWIPLIAAAALILFLLLRKPKPVQQPSEETPPLDPTGAGFSMGGGGAAGFQPGDISGMMTGWPPPTLIVQPKLTYQQVVQRRLGEPVKKIGNLVFKPLPGSNIVKTPSGGTATIGVNPNKPTFT